MSRLITFLRAHSAAGFVLAYVAVAAAFLQACAEFYIPGKGFSALVMFGERTSGKFIPELGEIPYYAEPDSVGYDAQYYAQLAMRPRLTDPALQHAVDNLPYRARRILFCVVPYLLAGGDPALALQIFSVQNIACWLVLAVILLRWFPPGTWNNFVRWAGTLLSFGLMCSVRSALVDGPSLMLIAAGLALLEAGRPWLASLTLAISGLGKETNILSGAVFAVPARNDLKAWAARLGQGMLVVLPLILWLILLKLWLGGGGETGARNFSFPLSGYFGKWSEAVAQLRAEGLRSFFRWHVLVLIGLTTQVSFLVLRPDWRAAWWRVGCAYAVLMVVLGEAVWEGYPGAAARVLLPLTLAFNVLVPRGGRWWGVLILGNVSVLLSADVMVPPAREAYRIEAPAELRYAEEPHRRVEIKFDSNWHAPERSRFEYWRWSTGSAIITIRNPHSAALVADLDAVLRVADAREVIVRQGERVWWSGSITPGRPERIQLLNLRLPPGDTDIHLETHQPVVPSSPGDLRRIAFNLRNLTLRLHTLE